MKSSRLAVTAVGAIASVIAAVTIGLKAIATVVGTAIVEQAFVASLFATVC